jgi:hypothetical protein
VPVAPDTYILSAMRAPVRGGGPSAQAAVLSEATAFCRQQDRELVLLSLLPDGDRRMYERPTAFDATFQCRLPLSATVKPVAMISFVSVKVAQERHRQRCQVDG